MLHIRNCYAVNFEVNAEYINVRRGVSLHGFDCCQRGSYTEATGGPDYLVKNKQDSEREGRNECCYCSAFACSIARYVAMV